MSNYRSIPGIKASGTVTQYRAVKMDTTNRQVVAITNANAPDLPIGILQNDPASGEAADIAHEGVAKAEYGGTITRGDSLAMDNTGKLITDAVVADGSAVDLYHLAKALESGSSGDVREVLIFPAQLIGLE